MTMFFTRGRQQCVGHWRWLVAVAAIGLSACGGGGGGASEDDGGALPQPQAPTTRVQLRSELGDYIGGGGSYTYTQADARITVSATGNRLQVEVAGDKAWTGEFQLPNSQAQLTPGTYASVQRAPFHDAAVGGLAWFGDGRGCNTLTGSITVVSATYSSAALTALELRFEQRCEGSQAALRGDIFWSASDTVQPAGPQSPVPTQLWRAAAADVPASGNYVYLSSQNGDYIGAGRTTLYTPATARLTLQGVGRQANVGVHGDQQWSGEFVAMDVLSRLVPGYYPTLSRSPFHNPVRGGLSWSGEGRGCNTLQGWFVVDSVRYEGEALTALDLRFEQRCEGGAAALRGQIRWRSDDTTGVPGPVNPPPTGLWQAPAASVPASGNHLLLQSDAGDYIGAGLNHSYTPLNARFTPVLEGGRLRLQVTGAQDWSGDFAAMDTVATMQPGYYGNLGRYPFHNPVRGGLSWSGNGRGCNSLSGWFVVDRMVVVSGQLQALELRFEQRCEGAAAALRGQLRWSADDLTQPPGPVNPPPGDLWLPAPGTTPASGNFVYLESRAGDYVGAGRTYLYTQANALLLPSENGRSFQISVRGFESWSATFSAMDSINQLQVGYYGDSSRFGGLRPGLAWGGDGRGCNATAGWFVVDNLSRRNGVLDFIELRFEQFCDGSLVPLRGQLRWSVNDSTQPPGPVNPPPADLWQAPASSTPASGNYVFLQSLPGDYVGGGVARLYTQADALLRASLSATGLTVSVQGDQNWSSTFVPMSGLSTVQPGYYANLQRWPFHNAVAGGFEWSGEGRGCNQLMAWVVVDEITVVAGVLQSVTLRFQQHCDGALTPLVGQLRWSANDTTAPPGPVDPPSAALWRPAPGATPATGNFVYLESGAGDYVGGGRTWLYTPANSTVQLDTRSGGLGLRVGNEWAGDFQAMLPLTQLRRGDYGELRRYPFHNPVKGGLNWSGMGRGCNQLTGWFAIDDISYAAGVVTAVDLRFEQHCDGSPTPLRGRVRWAAGNGAVVQSLSRPLRLPPPLARLVPTGAS